MFLSNQHAAALAILIVVFAAAGCSWFQSSDPVPLTPSTVTPPETSIPFETKEPDTYQADFVTIAGGIESRSRFARKNGRWRFDRFVGEAADRSIIHGEKIVYADHISKQYSEPPAGVDEQPAFISDLTTSLLNERQAAKFEKLDSEGKVERYSVTVEGSTSTILFDTEIKMVVRHSFDSGFAFEMRNFTLNVDDAVFLVPSGYRKVAWNAFIQQQ